MGGCQLPQYTLFVWLFGHFVSQSQFSIAALISSMIVCDHLIVAASKLAEQISVSLSRTVVMSRTVQMALGTSSSLSASAQPLSIRSLTERMMAFQSFSLPS